MGLPDGTICNSANEFYALRFPVEGATAKGLPVVTIDNVTLHLVGLRRNLASSKNNSNWNRKSKYEESLDRMERMNRIDTA